MVFRLGGMHFSKPGFLRKAKRALSSGSKPGFVFTHNNHFSVWTFLSIVLICFKFGIHLWLIMNEKIENSARFGLFLTKLCFFLNVYLLKGFQWIGIKMLQILRDMECPGWLWTVFKITTSVELIWTTFIGSIWTPFKVDITSHFHGLLKPAINFNSCQTSQWSFSPNGLHWFYV